jgi:hypothetical protein
VGDPASRRKSFLECSSAARDAIEHHLIFSTNMSNKEEIARRKTAALAAIKQSAEDSHSSVVLFASHHLEELDPTYWQQHNGTKHPGRKQILDLLELRSHWGGEGDDGIEVFDFTLPGNVTEYVISVRFDNDGAVEDISMES